MRDKDVDDEFMAMMKARPNVVLVPNLPDRGVAVDMSWLKDGVPAAELAKIQAGATDRPPAQQAFGIQARNLAKLNKAGVKITLGTDGGIVWSHHVEMADMVASGMTPAQVIVASTKAAAEFMRLTDEGHRRSRQERRLPRPRRQPARRHHEHAEDFGRLSARRRCRSCRTAGADDEVGSGFALA